MKKTNRDVIKLIALVLMSGNHYANIFLEAGSPLYCLLVYLGYFTAPAMCFFLVEGFYRTRSRRKYTMRLAVFALLSQLPYDLAFSGIRKSKMIQFNMIYSLLVSFLLLWVLDSSLDYGKKKAAILLLFAAGIFGDWSLMAQFFTLLFWILDRKRPFLSDEEYRIEALKTWSLVAATTFLMEFLGQASEKPPAMPLYWTAGSLTGPILAGLLIIFFYNGKRADRGRTLLKWFCYVYYPGHLLVLWLIRTGIR